MLQEGRTLSANFRTREREQGHNFHAACETLGDFRERQNVGRSGEQEPSWASIVINRLLDSPKQIGSELYLVNDCAVQVADHAGGIGLGGEARRLIVQGEI